MKRFATVTLTALLVGGAASLLAAAPAEARVFVGLGFGPSYYYAPPAYPYYYPSYSARYYYGYPAYYGYPSYYRYPSYYYRPGFRFGWGRHWGRWHHGWRHR